MKISIDALKISQRDLLGKDHLVACGHDVRIQEATVEDAETKAATDELEGVEVLGVDARRWVWRV